MMIKRGHNKNLRWPKGRARLKSQSSSSAEPCTVDIWESVNLGLGRGSFLCTVGRLSASLAPTHWVTAFLDVTTKNIYGYGSMPLEGKTNPSWIPSLKGQDLVQWTEVVTLQKRQKATPGSHRRRKNSLAADREDQGSSPKVWRGTRSAKTRKASWSEEREGAGIFRLVSGFHSVGRVQLAPGEEEMAGPRALTNRGQKKDTWQGPGVVLPETLVLAYSLETFLSSN